MLSSPATLPWLLCLGLLILLLIICLKLLQGKARQCTSLAAELQSSQQQQALLTERLSSHENEQLRSQQQSQEVTEQLRAKIDLLEQEIRQLQTQASSLQSDLASANTEAEGLRPLPAELKAVQGLLEEQRQQKAELEARLAALSSQASEERKGFEEQARLRAQAEAETLASKERRLNELGSELSAQRQQCSELQKRQATLASELAALHSKRQQELQAAEDKIAILQQSETRLNKEFENLANRIFTEKQRQFSQSSKENMEAILSPMRQQLSDFRKKVDSAYDTENRERASLRTEIAQLKSLNQRIGADALNLTRALKGDAKLRGNWGEMQLERLLEESGLSKGREYDVQVSLQDEAGKRLQPDVVVHLPEDKEVVIDSKVSLVAYEQYHAAEEDEQRQSQLRAHLASLRSHINSLSSKSYDELIGVHSLDLVIMFVPIEPALLLALEHDPGLFSEAFNQRILLVSPSTLMATLQIIHNIWRYEYQNLNALQIATDAGRLHDQFVRFVEALEDVGAKLAKASESYELAHKRLTSGRGNLVGRTIKLQTLGAKAKKKIAKKLADQAQLAIDSQADQGQD